MQHLLYVETAEIGQLIPTMAAHIAAREDDRTQQYNGYRSDGVSLQVQNDELKITCSEKRKMAYIPRIATYSLPLTF